MAPGLSPGQKMAVLGHFPDPEEIYYGKNPGLNAVEDVSPAALETARAEGLDQAERIYRFCVENGIGMLTYQDESYPERLRQIPEPPLVLYYRGVLPNLKERPVIAVTGTRSASPYGQRSARRISRQIANGGGLVVTGGAEGIDTMALVGAVEAGKPAIVLLPCGVDILYPKGNGTLYGAVLEHGCLLSEYPPKTPAHKWHFKRRNTVLSGMACGVLIVEAPAGSGALSTARSAFEQKRDVFTVPANVDVLTAEGSNALMKERAIPVATGWEVLQEYELLYPGKLTLGTDKELFVREHEPPVTLVAQKPMVPKTVPKTNLDRKPVDNGAKCQYSELENRIAALPPDARMVFRALDNTPKSVDQVVALTGLPAAKALSTLTMLAMKGLIRACPGKLFSL